MDDVGKKIRATGNGKCNIGNLDQTFECYSNSQFVAEIISSYKQEETLLSLGLPTKIMYGSGLYPVSESASNVVKVLRDRALFLGVNIILNAKLLDYQIENENQSSF
jgi:predicted flavoprotein YhiN